MNWKLCNIHCIKFKGDICPECFNKENNVGFKCRKNGEFKRGLEDRNEDYIKEELGIRE